MSTAHRDVAASSTLFAEKGRWVRQGAVLTATEAWEGPGVLEPTALYRGSGDWVGTYRAGGLHSEVGAQIGWMASADGRAWTKYASNPVLGMGAGGESGRTICPHLRKFGATYYIYYSNVDTQKLMVATSSTGLPPYTLHDTGLALPSGTNSFGNAHVIHLGSTYHLWVECYVVADGAWETYYATSTDGLSFTWGNSGNRVTSLQVAAGGSYGGIYIVPGSEAINGLYQTWMSASAVSGNAESDIFRFHTSSLTNGGDWTLVVPNPALGRSGQYEVDQVADPCVVEVGGASFMYYDADETSSGICAIKLATFAGTLAQLVGGR